MEGDNPVTLREYVDARLDALEHRLTIELNLRDRALNIARDEVNRRLEGMNELRDQIQSERGTYATREMLDQFKSVLEGRIARVEFGRGHGDDGSA